MSAPSIERAAANLSGEQWLPGWKIVRPGYVRKRYTSLTGLCPVTYTVGERQEFTHYGPLAVFDTYTNANEFADGSLARMRAVYDLGYYILPCAYTRAKHREYTRLYPGHVLWCHDILPYGTMLADAVVLLDHPDGELTRTLVEGPHMNPQMKRYQ